ncbi:hypothetical protein KQI36_03545 [Clostridium senegalense]|uniref:hypothetical protein n=1 Tax=Clostridium senegalense TaxID=1465809 RepID=UPI001C1147F8|nr:hypothetical protein [Clostridium senegalense]MBU5225745.1 hypothetical protein [Clostridium senegalense]
MKLYDKPSKELMDKLLPYKKSIENIEVSKPISHNRKLYREVIFIKKFTKNLSVEPENYMYIDEDDNVVEDRILCERLARIFYYMDIYLNEEKGSILAALQDEADINKDKNDYESVLEGLEIIKKGHPKNIDKVTYIIERLPSLRMKTNEKLKKLKEVIEEEKKKNEYFNERMIEILHPYYRQVMEVNYEKILLIGKGKDYYYDIKKKAEKKRRVNSILFNTRHNEKLMKTNYLLGYYNNLLKSYGNVLSMNYNQYIRTLDNAGMKVAANKMYLLRNNTVRK